jgi:integrase
MKRRNTDYFKATVGGFSGYPRIKQAFNNAKTNRAKSIFLGLFLTGSRAMELPKLKRSQIDLDYDEDNIFIRGLYVEKQKKVIFIKDDEGNDVLKHGRKTFTFESKEGYRSFPIRKDLPENLSEIFINFIKGYKNPTSIIYPFTYNQIYSDICRIESNQPPNTPTKDWWKYKGEWYPHRLRSERCCSLIKSHGYDTMRLQKYFGWSSPDMPNVYGDIQAEDLVVKGKVKW